MRNVPRERLLLLLVLADFALAMMTIAAEVAFYSTLPRALQDHADRILWWLFPWWVFMVVLTIAGWIALITFWRYARALYVTAWVIWLLLIAASGPSVMTAAGAVLTTLEALVAGAILALVYFTELGQRFEEEAEGGVTSSPAPESPAAPALRPSSAGRSPR